MCPYDSESDHQDETSVTLHVVGTSFVMLIVLANPELLGAGALARTFRYGIAFVCDGRVGKRAYAHTCLSFNLW